MFTNIALKYSKQSASPSLGTSQLLLNDTMLASFSKLASSRRAAAPTTVQSIASKSNIGSLSLLSTAPAAASKKPSHPCNNNQYGRVINPTVIVPPTPPPSPTPNQHHRHPINESLVWKAALQNLQRKQKTEIIGLEKMLDTLRIARMPANNNTTHTGVVSNQQPQQQQTQHTFQVMNRNARKPKRANHGKRPCSRIRRKYKVKKWANTRRKG